MAGLRQKGASSTGLDDSLISSATSGPDDASALNESLVLIVATPNRESAIGPGHPRRPEGTNRLEQQGAMVRVRFKQRVLLVRLLLNRLRQRREIGRASCR